jgi:hypothetical protein
MNKKKIIGKELILVVSMHRCGSSALMGILSILGLNIGNNLIGPKLDNKKGFFEDKNFVKLNNDILKANNASWYNIDGIKKGMIFPVLFKIRLINLLVKNLTNNEHLGLKDPRFSILVPCYIEICNYLKICLKIIVIHRNKESVIQSLLKRGYPKEIRAFDLNELYDFYINSIRNECSNYIVEEIKFEELIEKTDEVVWKIWNSFGWLEINKHSMIKVHEFLDPNLISVGCVK